MAIDPRPATMSDTERTYIEGMTGDAATYLLPRIARSGFLDFGDGPKCFSVEGQALATKRAAQYDKQDRFHQTLPRLPDSQDVRKRLGD